MSLALGSSPITAAYIGTTSATAVYIGSEKIWPLDGFPYILPFNLGAPSTTSFSDDFNRSDSTNLGSSWIESGEPEIHSNILTAPGTGLSNVFAGPASGGNSILFRGTNEISVTITLSGTAPNGCIAMYVTDGTRYYGLFLDPSAVLGYGAPAFALMDTGGVVDGLLAGSSADIWTSGDVLVLTYIPSSGFKLKRNGTFITWLFSGTTTSMPIAANLGNTNAYGYIAFQGTITNTQGITDYRIEGVSP